MTASDTPTSPRGHRTGDRLAFSRTFHAPVTDVWAACTEPARMERWIGTWTGDLASGQVAFRMTAEGEDVPEEIYLIEVCQPPNRLVLRSRDSYPFSPDGSGPQVQWQHTLELTEADGVTTLVFTQAVPDGQVGVDLVGSVGPGWDYYLDRLSTSIDGGDPAAVAFEPYLQRSEHYRSLFASGSASGEGPQGRSATRTGLRTSSIPSPPGHDSYDVPPRIRAPRL